MEFLLGSSRTVLSFVVVLGVLVFIHELGHYLAARWRGVHVEAFSIGFGRPLARWIDKVGTEWKICWIPLGGYVKLHGQGGVDEADGVVVRPEYAFDRKPVGSRAIVVAAGPIANFLLAIVLFAAVFMTFGRPVPSAVIGTVVPDSAAERGGLRQGDRILSIEGNRVLVFTDIVRAVESRPGMPVNIEIERDGQNQTLGLTLGRSPDGNRGLLGVGAGGAVRERLDPFSATAAGAATTWSVTVQTLSYVWQMITGQRGAEELGGPLRIAQLSGKFAEEGISSLMSFMAMLSVSLGLINLFPVPVLDGGHLVFYAIEALRGRPLSIRAQEIGLRIGLALLGTLFVFVMWNDLAGLGLFRWVLQFIG